MIIVVHPSPMEILATPMVESNSIPKHCAALRKSIAGCNLRPSIGLVGHRSAKTQSYAIWPGQVVIVMQNEKKKYWFFTD